MIIKSKHCAISKRDPSPNIPLVSINNRPGIGKKIDRSVYMRVKVFMT